MSSLFKKFIIFAAPAPPSSRHLWAGAPTMHIHTLHLPPSPPTLQGGRLGLRTGSLVSADTTLVSPRTILFTLL